nr:hypothetical protein BaRGS_021527 [Batillaria attramentaria]KAG5696454.1 hypothetical protein BaRGS_020991 [Batillaria attramentaria]KAG5704181.1 hypothetical protein BaRGS_009711 [Batillaria attramentaria]KAG5707897.1 hypothetical protein BaRGS_031628 [Batillaria attramentaria]KAG5708817.1 hypothetical protein BaRGS_031971 [Batillaria attramentaria]
MMVDEDREPKDHQQAAPGNQQQAAPADDWQFAAETTSANIVFDVLADMRPPDSVFGPLTTLADSKMPLMEAFQYLTLHGGGND